MQNAVCSAPGMNPPTTEYLYAVDGLGNQVFEFQVNTSSGVLTNPSNATSMPSFPTDQTPAGVAVDPCNRFVYVSEQPHQQNQRLHDLQRLSDCTLHTMFAADAAGRFGSDFRFAVQHDRWRTGRARSWWILLAITFMCWECCQTRSTS